MSNANREIARSWFDQVWNAGDESAIDRLMSPAAKLHGLASGTGEPIVGPAGFKPFFHAFRDAFPDIRIRVVRTINNGQAGAPLAGAACDPILVYFASTSFFRLSSPDL